MVGFLRSAVLCLLTLASAASARWGEEGHKIIAWIAHQRLNDAARAELDRLMATEATNLPDAAYWPDAVARRQAQYRFANPLHYANVPRGMATYEPDRDRPPEGDIVSAIASYADILRDRTKPDAQRLEALRFLAHFVGDIHQPLHVGYKEDRGGNDLNVYFYNRRAKVHQVWDSGIIERSGFAWEDFAAQLHAMIRPQDIAAYTETMDPLQWARESFALAESEVYAGLAPDDRLARPYVDAKLPVVEDQLSIAGVRLAAMLNEMFPGAPPPPDPLIVHVTPSGKKYHAAGCRYLRAANDSMPLDDARASGFSPCSVCDPPQ